ncbi:hypothetical protein [Congregibacter litoralis]|uniref:Nucleotidyltransferase family protein n=1 Tax=Congregibacter litoralis KT71 TaxID=314285 RepID=A4A4T5_9GAMM|nr:hypothetical protein [Congregibacter litoralis]EAQ98806.1 hypothetical protein KT71_09272 [Congregibacter litoralis KT71]
MSLADLDVEQLAARVCESLESKGIHAVLTGGSCVSVWSENEYASNDLDFITLGLDSNRAIGLALKEIGFIQDQKGRYFTHPETDMFIEFPTGPLMVGNEHVEEQRVAKRETDAGVVRLLNPTDCIKDRLAAYYHWGDVQCFEQALMVARRQAVDWQSLKVWHRREGQAKHFDAFKEAALE